MQQLYPVCLLRDPGPFALSMYFGQILFQRWTMKTVMMNRPCPRVDDPDAIPQLSSKSVRPWTFEWDDDSVIARIQSTRTNTTIIRDMDAESPANYSTEPTHLPTPLLRPSVLRTSLLPPMNGMVWKEILDLQNTQRSQWKQSIIIFSNSLVDILRNVIFL